MEMFKGGKIQSYKSNGVSVFFTNKSKQNAMLILFLREYITTVHTYKMIISSI